MGNRLQVRRAVPVFYEESLVVLESVRSPEYGVMKEIGIIIFHHLTHALFEIAGRNDAAIRVRSAVSLFARRRETPSQSKKACIASDRRSAAIRFCIYRRRDI